MQLFNCLQIANIAQAHSSYLRKVTSTHIHAQHRDNEGALCRRFIVSCAHLALVSSPVNIRKEDVQATVGHGEEEADQRPRYRRGRRCGCHQEDVQPAPPLHPGEGQERGHPQGLLLRPRAHRQGSPGVQVDQNPAVLLREGPQGEAEAASMDRQMSGCISDNELFSFISRRQAEVPLSRLVCFFLMPANFSELAVIQPRAIFDDFIVPFEVFAILISNHSYKNSCSRRI